MYNGMTSMTSMTRTKRVASKSPLYFERGYTVYYMENKQKDKSYEEELKKSSRLRTEHLYAILTNKRGP